MWDSFADIIFFRTFGELKTSIIKYPLRNYELFTIRKSRDD